MIQYLIKRTREIFGSYIDEPKVDFLDTDIVESTQLSQTLYYTTTPSKMLDKTGDGIVLLRSIHLSDLYNPCNDLKLNIEISYQYYTFNDEYEMEYKGYVKKKKIKKCIASTPRNDTNVNLTMLLYENQNSIEAGLMYMLGYEDELIKTNFYEFTGLDEKKYCVLLKDSNFIKIVNTLRKRFKEVCKRDIDYIEFKYSVNDGFIKTYIKNEKLVFMESEIISKFRYYLSEVFFKHLQNLEIENCKYYYENGNKNVILNVIYDILIIQKQISTHYKDVMEIIDNCHPDFKLMSKVNSPTFLTFKNKNNYYIEHDFNKN